MALKHDNILHKKEGKKPMIKSYKYQVEITDADVIDATQSNTEGPPRITDSPISWRKSESAEDSFQSWIRNRGTATFAEIIPSLIEWKIVRRRSWTDRKSVV